MDIDMVVEAAFELAISETEDGAAANDVVEETIAALLVLTGAAEDAWTVDEVAAITLQNSKAREETRCETNACGVPQHLDIVHRTTFACTYLPKEGRKDEKLCSLFA